MTFISYTVTLDDNDLQTLQEALSHYLALCENEILNGASEPFLADRESIKDIRSKLLEAILRGLRSHERWVRRGEKIRALAKAPVRPSRAKRAISRTRAANKQGRGKRKPK